MSSSEELKEADTDISRPHQCQTCGKSYSRICSLKRHELTHTAEKLYHCEQCDSSFSELKTYKLHLQTHTEETPYCCSLCGRHFSDQSSYRKHLSSHTGPYQCDRCEKTFSQWAINPSLTEDVKGYLTGTEGGSITLPDPLMVRGFVSFGRIILAMVENKNIEVYEELYKDRLLWDSDTGLFSITGLQRNDSGIYNIDSKKGNVFTASYKLTVYESVPTPAVSTLSVSADGCTLLCFVKKAEEATLSWYKDEEILNQTGSVLSLPLTVHSQDFSFSYRCVAANLAENKTRPVNVTTLCSDQNNTDSRSNMNTRQYVIVIGIPIVLAVILLFVITWKCLDKNKRTIKQTQDALRTYLNKKPREAAAKSTSQATCSSTAGYSTSPHYLMTSSETQPESDSVSSEPDVNYADIDISEDRRSQVGLQTHPQGGNLPDSSRSADNSYLTTVCYKPL
ncbi:uncharacterized protein LOC126391020 isoform X1 [Epinephelus moara]|uniref:uncharacterized protein LOC126391020 isoform X1 n=1 Tax=Epinephelus moara TaxID=300413 RepID=UPI00214EB82F|nr:uncharacterized protein LOC126391020 isoform X1 [Epinephelus moara]